MLHSRRNFLRQTGAGLLGLPLAPALFGGEAATPATGERPPPAEGALPPLNRFPRMLQEWTLAQVRQAEARGDDARERMHRRADAEAYVASVRRRIAESFGPLPEKTPLNARVTGATEGRGYSIERVIFESRPGFLVTGNLYLPAGGGKKPAVLGLCGHWEDSKADAVNHQSFAQGLAQQGFVCLVIDPVGQGERRQYLEGNLQSPVRFGVPEHLQMGNQQALVGEFLGTWFAWDAIRALDYLETRPEVDSSRLGATGCSGGGTQTAWLAALDPRLTMIAPACFVTTLRRNAENELPVDPEQCPPRALALNLDHSDFLAAFAPRPAIILAQERDDIFDVRGAVTAYQRLKRLYTLLGRPDNIQLLVGPDHHGYSQPCREAMYRWFGRAAGLSENGDEPPVRPVPAAELWCTPRGQVADLHSRTLMSFTAESARRLCAGRTALRGETLRRAVREALKLLPLSPTTPDYRILRSAGERRYPSPAYCTYAVETEPGIEVPLTRLYPAPHNARLPRESGGAILYVSHHSADADLRDENLVRQLIAAQPAAAFYACDLRGIGDSQPNTCGVDQFFRPYGSHYFYAAYGQLLDRPLLGQRTFDLLRAIQLLMAVGHERIQLAGRGWGALPAAFAALLSPAAGSVTLKNALRSYLEVAETKDYQWPCALLLTGVLREFDLPDCYAELAGRGLVQIEPWGPHDGLR